MRKQEICFKGRLGRGAFHWRVRKRRVRGRKGDDGGGGSQRAGDQDEKGWGEAWSGAERNKG